MAGGFAIEDHSARQLGDANAGAAAAAEDASTIADNPAGIALLEKPQVSGTGIVVDTHLPFANSGSRLPTGAPLGGGNDDGGGFALLPNLFATTPVTADFSFGVGLFPSFGLATNYAYNWVGRYAALATKVTSFDLVPTAAYRLLPNLAIGASPVLRYSKIRLTNAIDFGSIGAGLGLPGAIPGGSDGAADVRGEGWSLGFNLGLIAQPIGDTRVGIAYFHNAAARVSGPARFSRSPVGDAIAAATGAFANTSASGDVPYPDRASVGVVHSLTPELDLRGGFAWTQWNSFQTEYITFGNGIQPPAVMSERWRNTVTVSLGGNYRIAPDWVLRAGLEYDQTPVPGPSNRDPRIPDASRIEAAIGASYAVNASTSIDFAYEHLFGGTVRSADISATGDQLNGSTRVSADIFALQVTYSY
ncbi:MAG: outer membrane protein transport protein [Alphaproteobacteria bacterium]|nr:outer membrane protein transport protein [Alphaproteobacteria bacterium]